MINPAADGVLAQPLPALVAWLEKTLEEALMVFNLPEGRRKGMRPRTRWSASTKKPADAPGGWIFPIRPNYPRLATALAMEQSDE